MNFIPLPESFYEPAADAVALRLLGHWLIRKTANGFCGGPIVETEAYLVDDPASHGFVGETARNRVMYGPPGRAYVYFIYGAHYCVNTVCRHPGHAEGVLIRAIEVGLGEHIMRENRATTTSLSLTNGPGKLCAALAIDRKLNGVNLFDTQGPLFIATNPDLNKFRKSRGPVMTTARIGITKAAHLPLRFYLEHSEFISKRPPSPRSNARRGARNPSPTKR
jgi:DNA-3-methyladenine glycosylase